MIKCKITIHLSLEIGNNADPINCSITAEVYIPRREAIDDYTEVSDLFITEEATGIDLTEQASEHEIKCLEESLVNEARSD